MTQSSDRPHLAIIGAGPAGLGAAIAAREADLRVTVIDDQVEPGGQIWRGASRAPLSHAQRLGSEYMLGRERVQQFMSCGADYMPQHTLWHFEFDGEKPVLQCAGPNGARTIRPDIVLIATGALERPVPVPGWTLPGVMTAGGLQILLKSAQLTADRAVLAGAGPLLWLLASQMVAVGTPPLAVVETSPVSNYLGAALRLPYALKNPGLIFKGLGLIAKVRRAGVPLYFSASNLRIDGDARVRALTFDNWAGRRRLVEAETVGLHGGVIPNQQLSRLLRLTHDWNEAQHAFVPRRKKDLSVGDRVYLAGDGSRIGGAEVAWLEGQLIGNAIAGRDVSKFRQAIKREDAPRAFVDRLYKLPPSLRQPSDETVICRCEGITAGRIRQAARDGATGPNQVKFTIRAGMGPCQGRVCGAAISEIIAMTRNKNMSEAGYFRIRPPLKPVPMSVIAASGIANAMPMADQLDDETSDRTERMV